jgi:phosphoribosylformylglycinamidine (FGAM) synthase-like enzyme
MFLKLSVHANPSIDEALLRGPRETLGLTDLRVWRDYYFEVQSAPSADALERLRLALGDPRCETVTVGEPLVEGEMVQVAYLRGIVDNESDSLLLLCELVGVDARAARVAITYASASGELAERVRTRVLNPSIEELQVREPSYTGLQPLGLTREPARHDLRGLQDAELLALGSDEGRNLDLDKMRAVRRIQESLGLAFVTDVLVEAVDARWSDHCMHTTWLSLGDLLGVLADASARSENANILSMFEDNAGVWDFYDGFALAIKAETHNGPSGISAYFGQLTKVGGVLRDILGTGLGADPIGVFEYTATGLPGEPAPIPGRPSPKQIANETIRGVKEYGNTFGVPMMAAHMTFHHSYRAKPFALGGSVGLMRAEHAGRRRPEPGDLLVLIGGLTGNDGIHGASASSAGSAMDHAAVQIGAPLEQVKFRQAILDLRDAGCVRALTDLGAAGLNSAAGELGDPGGVWLNTALVPLKTSSLPTWTILLSESQERMILAVPRESIARAKEILDRHLVRNTAIGVFTADGRYTVVHEPGVSEAQLIALQHRELPGDPDTGFSVPYELLRYRPPALTAAPPERGEEPTAPWPALREESLAQTLAGLLADPELASQRLASSQYDSTVRGHTVYGPTAGSAHVPTSFWAGTPLYGSPAAVLLATSFNPWLFERDPVLAARQMFLAALNKLVLAGVARGDVCLCDNFYTPDQEPDGFGWLVAMVHELAELVDCFGTPLVSGKDSSAGSASTPEGIVSVPPAVFLSAVGKLPDVSALRRNEWRAAGNLLVRVGPDTPSPAGTVAERVLRFDGGRRLDAPSPERYRSYLDALAQAGPLILSGRPIGAGGTLCCLALGAISSALGVELLDIDGAGPEALLCEHRCGALVEVPEARVGELPDALAAKVVGRLRADARGVSLRGGQLLTPAALGAWRDSWEALLA